MREFLFKLATQLSAALQAKDVSATDLVEAHLR